MKNDNQKIKYFVYCRKSTDDKERQILSLVSQEDAMKDIATRNRLQIIDTLKESKSAKAPDKRPVFAEMIKNIKAGKANGIICWELSRLARNPDEAGLIMGMLQRGEIKHIKTYGKDYYSDDNAVISSVEFGIANQFSRDLAKNVKRGLRDKAKTGWRPTRAPLGYLNSKTKLKGEQNLFNDSERFDSVKHLWQMILTGNYTVPELLDFTNDKLHLTQPATPQRPERKLTLNVLYRMFSNTFYYGWYDWKDENNNLIQIKGNHESIITEDEFWLVQKVLGRKGRPKPTKHKFAFTGLIQCPCGGMVTAEERFKKQKNGNVHHYIYYHCTRKIKPDCTEKAIEIKDLDKQIDDILGRLNISERFQDWAVKYLHEIRKTEARSQDESFVAKQKALNKLVEQQHNLLLKYTLPDNADGHLISDQDFESLKTRLVKEKSIIETELNTQGKVIDQWVELSERTFNFARYARVWFARGDVETKRAIFSCLGSNFLLKDQKLALTMRKSFEFIFEGLPQAEQELERLEPVDWGSIKGKSEAFASEFPVLSGMRESDSRPHLGRVLYYHYTNPAFARRSELRRASPLKPRRRECLLSYLILTDFSTKIKPVPQLRDGFYLNQKFIISTFPCLYNNLANQFGFFFC